MIGGSDVETASFPDEGFGSSPVRTLFEISKNYCDVLKKRKELKKFQ